MAPSDPYPCAVIDAVSGYLHLLETYNASDIVFIGDSAGTYLYFNFLGGGLLLATMLVLRDMGKPLPAGGCCLSPWVIYTKTD